MGLYVDIAFILLSIVLFMVISFPNLRPKDSIWKGPRVFGFNLKAVMLKIVAICIFIGSLASILEAKEIITKEAESLINTNTNGITILILLSLVLINSKEKKGSV